MDIDKIINIVREQNLKVGRKLPADFPGLGGGGGGTNALTSQAKVRTWGASLKSLIGGDDRLAKQSFNDPQRYLDDKDYKNRGTYADYKRRQADQVLANKKPLPHHKSYKNQFGESMGAGAVSGPTNNVGAPPGNIAGIHGDPPVDPKKKKKGEPTIIGRGCFPGARTRWRKGIG